jgi:WD40 repeat protein
MWALTILVPMSQVLGFLRVVEGPQTKLSLLFARLFPARTVVARLQSQLQRAKKGGEMEEGSIRKICFLISDLILRSNKVYDKNTMIDTLITEILTDIDLLHLQRQDDDENIDDSPRSQNHIKSALTDLKGAIISLMSSIETTDQFFHNSQQKACESMNSNSLTSQILATRLRLLASLYLHRYFSENHSKNSSDGADEFYHILNDFLQIPSVRQALLVEFDHHPLDNLWRKLLEPTQADLTNQIIQEISLFQQILQTLTSHEYPITTRNGEIHLCHFHLLTGHDQQINSLVMYDDILISGSTDMTIKLWDTHQSHEIITFSGHTSAITSLSVYDDRIYSSDELGYIKIWDTEILTEISSNRTRKQSITCLTVSSDRIYCGYNDGYIFILDIDSFIEISSFHAHATCVKQILIISSSSSAAAAAAAAQQIISCGKIVKIWNTNPSSNHSKKYQLIKKIRGHDHGVTCLLLHENRLYTAARSIRIWNLGTTRFELIGECKKHSHDIKSLCLHQNYLYSASRVIRIWDVMTCQLIQVLRGYSSPITAMTISNYGIIFTGCEYRKEIQMRQIEEYSNH